MKILQANGQTWIPSNPAQLEQRVIPREIPIYERMRRYFGPSLTPEVIEAVLFTATQGWMRDLTDLTNESLAIDPHFASVTGKRVRAVASIEPQFIPASGPGLDPAIANEICQKTRDSIVAIPNLREATLALSWSSCFGRAAVENHWTYTPEARARGGLPWQCNGFGWVHPRRLHFGPERELLVRDGMWQGFPFERVGYDIRETPGKFIWVTPRLFNEYPEREGFGPRALFWVFFKRFSQRERMRLVEVFGKPWRVAYRDPAAQNITTQDDAIDAIRNEMDLMGAQSSAVLPPGWMIKTDQPGESAGQVHKEVNEDSNAEMSKLILGQTRTTDAEPGALGSSGDQVAQDSESLVIDGDASTIAEAFTRRLVRPFVALNWGEQRAEYAPRMVMRFVVPPPRGEQIDNTNKALSTGVPLKLAQVYERIGFEKPGDDDETITAPAQVPGVPGAGGMFSAGGDAVLPLAQIQRQLSSLTRQLRIERARTSSRR